MPEDAEFPESAKSRLVTPPCKRQQPVYIFLGFSALSTSTSRLCRVTAVDRKRSDLLGKQLVLFYDEIRCESCVMYSCPVTLKLHTCSISLVSDALVKSLTSILEHGLMHGPSCSLCGVECSTSLTPYRYLM